MLGMPSHYVYILQSADRRYYVGYTTDLQRRMAEHQRGEGAKFTRGFGFAALLYHENYGTRSEALKREAELKQWSRAEKETLIRSAPKQRRRTKGLRAAAGGAALALLVTLWGAAGCNGSVHSPTLEGNFLQYPDAPTVTYPLSGTATCEACGPDDHPAGFLIELSMKRDPIQNFLTKPFNHLGAFSVGDLHTVADAMISVRGTLYFQGAPESTALHGYAEYRSPDDDGEAVTITLRFPSQEPAE
jgi:putative endonuclease